MTAEPNRQPEGIPTGGQFATRIKSDDVVALAVAPEPPKTIGDILSDQYLAVKERYEAHGQNEWADEVQAKYPDAAYAYFGVTSDRGGRYTAGMGLYDAAGEEIGVDEADAVRFEDRFDVFWDMGLHETDNSRAIFTRNSEVFSLASVKDRWENHSTTAPAVDPFAHLTGLAKAKAQGAHARELSTQAAAAYVDHLTSGILAAEPNAARINLSREVDVEFGHHFTLQSVISADGDVLDVDLTALQDESFHDIFLDPHTDYDESDGQIYIDLIPAA